MNGVVEAVENADDGLAALADDVERAVCREEVVAVVAPFADVDGLLALAAVDVGAALAGVGLLRGIDSVVSIALQAIEGRGAELAAGHIALLARVRVAVVESVQALVALRQVGGVAGLAVGKRALLAQLVDVNVPLLARLANECVVDDARIRIIVRCEREIREAIRGRGALQLDKLVVGGRVVVWDALHFLRDHRIYHVAELALVANHRLRVVDAMWNRII